MLHRRDRTAWTDALFLLSVALLPCGCAPRERAVEEVWTTMGTFASVSVPSAERGDLPRHAEMVRRYFAEVEELASIFRPDSELSRLNNATVGTPIAVSPPLRDVLELALKYAALTDGAFDPTVGPILKLWGFHGGPVPGALPTEAQLSAVLAQTGFRNVVVTNSSATILVPGVQVDLGGIAKGYAVDAAYERLVASGATNILVNLGGNMRCGGLSGRRGPWRVGVRNPFDGEKLVGTLLLSDGLAVATSGNYERFVTIRGERYAHIIDPRTGYPVKGMAGVTVVSRSATEADAMSTSLFVLGPEGAGSAMRRTPGCEALLIPDVRPLRLLVTPGFGRYFSPLPEFREAIVELPTGH